MKNIIGIKLKKEGKIYSFDADNLQLKKNDSVIVNTDSGLAMGTVVVDVRSTPLDKLPDNLKKVIRKTTEEDLKIKEENQKFEKEAFSFCLARIREKNLSMKLVDVECLLDKSKTIFYFTAENRVDFRELVKDLVQKFRTRIELRQIGIRNGTRMLGGIGTCGREICCARFLSNFDRVSIKMAKEQNMSLNPEKISGLCGRLMCCLAFEYDSYLDMKKSMPKYGKSITTSEGEGKVTRQNVLEGKITVELEDGKEIDVDIKDL
ncbi:MAG: stage 0 sporulation family protein [Thermodesulfobacteriota bacterium]|nr:stage 0 sporulation family protein [Thermodesulfobacteriota bacterium]